MRVNVDKGCWQYPWGLMIKTDSIARSIPALNIRDGTGIFPGAEEMSLGIASDNEFSKKRLPAITCWGQ